MRQASCKKARMNLVRLYARALQTKQWHLYEMVRFRAPPLRLRKATATTQVSFRTTKIDIILSFSKPHCISIGFSDMIQLSYLQMRESIVIISNSLFTMYIVYPWNSQARLRGNIYSLPRLISIGVIKTRTIANFFHLSASLA